MKQAAVKKAVKRTAVKKAAAKKAPAKKAAASKKEGSVRARLRPSAAVGKFHIRHAVGHRDPRRVFVSWVRLGRFGLHDRCRHDGADHVAHDLERLVFIRHHPTAQTRRTTAVLFLGGERAADVVGGDQALAGQ